MEPDSPGDARAEADGRPVIVLGASAGGLEALARFLEALPEELGAAYVVLMHLDPRRPSNLPSLLRSHTSLPVVEAVDGTELRPDHVYVPPAGALVTFDAGRLRSQPAAADRRWGIDAALRSLASDTGAAGVAVILSGSGSDGSRALESVSRSGGLVIAQEERSAGFPGMPQSAIATGLVDCVLPPEEMPGAIAGFLARRHSIDAERDLPSELIREILAQVASDTGRDFRDYKDATLRRRIIRRMSVVRDGTPRDYLERLRSEPQESERLLRDLLIGVTSFFRDAQAFAALETAMEELVAEKGPGDPIRVWVPGCSSGMEAYSLAILLTELSERTASSPEIQIFATEIDEDALDVARRGEYPETIEEQVSADRLGRFFTRVDHGYRINKSIRDLIVFSLHDVTSDPPFSRLDLVSCRNLLIYLDPPLQRRLIALFHYALRPAGLLLLGSAEGLAGESRLFDVVGQKAKLFRQRPGATSRSLHSPTWAGGKITTVTPSSPRARRLDLSDLGAAILSAAHTPPAVLINEAREILCYYGHTGPYLEAPSGVPDLDLLHMVRPELAVPLRTALVEAARTDGPVVASAVALIGDEAGAKVDLTVRPVHDQEAEPGLTLVVFEPARAPGVDLERFEGGPSDPGDRVRQHLERELAGARKRLHSTVEALEIANQDLRSANEELMSMNEELQSLNEELETVNDELAQKIVEAEAARANLANLLRSARIATVFLDRDLLVKSFTPAATDVFRLAATDVGRPVSDVRCDLEYDSLEADARSVMERLTPLERQATTADGREFTVRVSPYRSDREVIEGVVFTFIDITRLREAEASERRLATVVADSNDAVAVVDLDGLILEWNHGATTMYGYETEEVVGRSFEIVLPGTTPGGASRLVERWMSGRSPVPVETRRRRKDGTLVDVSSTATPLADPTGRFYAIATTERDISDQKRREAQLEFLLRELDHRVKNSLATILALVEQTASSTETPEECAAALRARISALVDIHETLAGERWGEVSVVQMVRTALTPNATSEEQFEVHDDDCYLRPHVATPLFMALHELAVNARKHGALSTPEGRVLVDVEVDPGEELRIHWREVGGPPVAPPQRKGFGMTVIQRGLKYEVGGEALVEFEPTGLTAHLTVPLGAQDDGGD